MKRISFLLILCTVSFPIFGQEIKTFESSDGLTLYYQISGTGKPLFLISMGPGYAPNYLFEVADSLSNDFQVVLLHQRGTGLSKMDSISMQNMNMDLYLKDIEELRKHLNFEKISLMGNSFGGIITMSYAAKYPDRIKSFILAGSGGIDLEFSTYFRSNIQSRLSIKEVEEIQKWSALIKANERVREANYEMLKITVPAYFYDKKHSEKILSDINEESYNYLVSDLLWMDLITKSYDLKPKFKDFKPQVLIIIGRQDIVGETTAYKTNKSIPNSQLMFIEECGHLPWIEQPEIFYRAVSEFLNKK